MLWKDYPNTLGNCSEGNLHTAFNPPTLWAAANSFETGHWRKTSPKSNQPKKEKSTLQRGKQLEKPFSWQIYSVVWNTSEVLHFSLKPAGTLKSCLYLQLSSLLLLFWGLAYRFHKSVWNQNLPHLLFQLSPDQVTFVFTLLPHSCEGKLENHSRCVCLLSKYTCGWPETIQGSPFLRRRTQSITHHLTTYAFYQEVSSTHGVRGDTTHCQWADSIRR